ncbi:hypothetical protein O5O51_01775 [Sinirhodobacter sp. HNIBRBA609]|nr:hypothetical protein O5O51_01775 [Sinirhodobacter sp. HNIBRBA609]
MTEAAIGLLSALLGAVLGAFATYWFALRQDKVARRRERVVAHLIEAYRNLENAAGREPMTEDHKTRVESSIAATFLLGSKSAAIEAKKLAEDTARGSGSMVPLLKQMRSDLREELGLEQHDVEPQFLRFWRNEGKRK